MTRFQRPILFGLGGLLFLSGTWQVGNVAITWTKAWLAPVLIEQAWQRAKAGETGDAIKPWPWADTAPVQRVRFPEQDQTLYTLDGATGSAMAFGPVLSTETPTPVLFGHRDTHFRFLEHVRLGDRFEVTKPDGTQADYEIVESAVRHMDSISIPTAESGEFMALVTCWPFDAMAAGGPLRYVLLAEKIEDS